MAESNVQGIIRNSPSAKKLFYVNTNLSKVEIQNIIKIIKNRNINLHELQLSVIFNSISKYGSKVPFTFKNKLVAHNIPVFNIIIIRCR